MAYTLEIGTGASLFTFDATTVFPERVQNQFNSHGCLDRRTQFIRIRGIRVGSTASDTFDKLDALRGLAERNTAQRVAIKLDSVLRRELLPAAMLEGPHIVDFSEDDTPGGKANHISYTMLVRFVQGRSVSGEEVNDIDRSVERTFENNRLVRKVWKITVKAKTLGEAKALADSFKPDVDQLDWQDIKQLDRNTYQATYIWKAQSDEQNGVISISERITLSGGEKPINTVRITGNPPIFRKGQIRPFEVRIETTVRGVYSNFDDARAVLFVFLGSLHYGEDSLDKNASQLFFEPDLINESTGEFEGKQIEVHRFIDRPDPPDHSAFLHENSAEEDEDSVQEPGDGAGFTQSSQACS